MAAPPSKTIALLLLSFALGCGGTDAPPADLPLIPVGADAYTRWDHWADLRVGTRTSMRSTYDRQGIRESGAATEDTGNFLRREGDLYIPLDLSGPGVLTFASTDHWHGSPWHYRVDGQETVVSESSTKDPNHPVAGSIFVPTDVFPTPLSQTWSSTHGADLSWVPIPFEQTLQIAYSRTSRATGTFIYQQFPFGAQNLSSKIQGQGQGQGSNSGAAPGSQALALLSAAGQDIATGAFGAEIGVYRDSGLLNLPAGDTVLVKKMNGGPAIIRALRLSVAMKDAVALGHARLRITWDNRAMPSVDAPVALFFGTGTLFNRDNREYLVKALPVNVHFIGDSATGQVQLSVYFPMPFAKNAKIELISQEAVGQVAWEIRSQARSEPTNWVGYFHATYKLFEIFDPGQDLILLDTPKEEGGGDWCGTFTGTSLVFSDRADLSNLAGDPRFFFDDSQTPQVQGTSTVEWAGGGYESDGTQILPWGGKNTTLPLAGHPSGAPSLKESSGVEDRLESAYRFLLADAMPFGKNARIQLEHGGLNDSIEHYRTLAYWYGLPGACLKQTDTLHVSDPTDEASHRYTVPMGTPTDALTSRYEWGVDQVGNVVIYPETTDTGRHHNGTSEFTLKIDAANFGVLLRRKLDYQIADQRAQVFVADDRTGARFELAGTWYLAGSTQCVYANPEGELDIPSSTTVASSNHRWRDDEFLLPRLLTEGRDAIRVRIVSHPLSQLLYPGAAPQPAGFSEYRYTAYVWTLPANP